MSAPDPRHRAMELAERVLAAEECPSPAFVARLLIARLENAGLVIHDAPAPGPTGFCDAHGAPQPCHGCAADAKARPDNPED